MGFRYNYRAPQEGNSSNQISVASLNLIYLSGRGAVW